jgi:endonuclease YncB( thermonuclease family)
MTLTHQNIQQYRTVVMAIMLGLMALFAAPAHAATASKDYAGRILLDAGRHGEAWYVHPETLQRTSLGRPNAALDLLTARASYASFASISRIAETADGTQDEGYAATVAGLVLTPNDLIGASWYVHPATHLRMRLATPADALAVMQAGLPVSSRVLDAIDVQPDPEARVAMTKDVPTAETADTLKLVDGTTVRLLSVDTPSNPDLQAAAKALLTARLAAKPIFLEKDVRKDAEDGAKLRYVIAGGVNLSQDLIRNGLAFPNITTPNLRYAEQLIVASIDAKNQKRGFWSDDYQATRVLTVATY